MVIISVPEDWVERPWELVGKVSLKELPESVGLVKEPDALEKVKVFEPETGNPVVRVRVMVSPELVGASGAVGVP